MIKIVLAEDHQLVREGIKFLLEKEEGFEVVAEFDNGEDVITKLRGGLEVDVALVDLKMPVMDGVVLLGLIKNEFPDVKVAILSMMDHERYLRETFDLGAKGYILKNVSSEEMIFAIKHINEGRNYICSELSMKIYNKSIVNKIFTSDTIELSEKEHTILKLTADGYTNCEVGDILKISRRTVEGMRKNLIAKSGTKNTAELIQYAFRSGLLR